MVPVNAGDPFVFHVDGHPPGRVVPRDTPFTVFTEDCFSGRLTTSDGHPREVAPYPQVNPLSGPFFIDGVEPGDIVAITLRALVPARDWGVATISPNFGLLSGTRGAPNLQPAQDERVWIWRFAGTDQLVGEAADGQRICVPYRPFHGTIALAPAHGEVRLGLWPGDYGGNLDIPDLGPGATLYLRAGVAGGQLYLGDGHYAQGDGEIAGTAVEGAFLTTLSVTTVAMDADFDWPRLATPTMLGVIGAARPLEDAARIAVAGMVRWLAARRGLSLADAQQLVSQTCRLRIGNLVNPLYTVLCAVPRRWCDPA